jgi:ribosomal subunit interface protein
MLRMPVQVTFHGMAPSAALEQAILRRAGRLERFHPQLVSCHAVVESAARRRQQGRQFVVRLDIKVAGGKVASNRDRSEDAFVAVRDAFDAARRQLEDATRRRRSAIRARRRPGKTSL